MTNSPLKGVYVAASPLCTSPSGENAGDGVFASENYEPGTQITSLPRPMIGALDDERLPEVCANCFKWVVWEASNADDEEEAEKIRKSMLKCGGCKRMRYCGKACQKEHWRNSHKHICKSFSNYIGREIPKGVLATMEILLRRKAGVITDEEWESLLQMKSHLEDFMKTKNVYGEIALMAEGAGAISGTGKLFEKDFVAGMYCRILTNSLTLVTQTLDPLGLVFDPHLARINHSCNANAYIMMDGAFISLRCLKPIKKDEEIFISYTESSNPFSRRQWDLQSRWFFTCRCSKCEQGPTGDEDEFLIEPKKLSKRFKDMADDLIKQQEYARHLMNYVGDSNDDKRVAALQGKAFDYLERAQQAKDPVTAIKECEDGMRLCKQSGLWPVYRQPYTALREKIIEDMLQTDQFHIAFQHCTKRYRYILPKLYPDPWHPVRVLRVATMAKLAVFLASERDDPTCRQMESNGVNLSIIAYMLTKEVKELSVKSHGAESSFARLMKRKLRDMEQDMIASVGEAAAQYVAGSVEQQKEFLRQMGDWLQY